MIHFVMLNVEKGLLLFRLEPPHVFSLVVVVFVPNHVMNFYTSGRRSVREPRAADMILRVEKHNQNGIESKRFLSYSFVRTEISQFFSGGGFFGICITSFHAINATGELNFQLDFLFRCFRASCHHQLCMRTHKAKRKEREIENSVEILKFKSPTDIYCLWNGNPPFNSSPKSLSRQVCCEKPASAQTWELIYFLNFADSISRSTLLPILFSCLSKPLRIARARKTCFDFSFNNFFHPSRCCQLANRAKRSKTNQWCCLPKFGMEHR